MPLDIALIEKLRPQNQVSYYPTLGSTMTEASRLAQEGSPHGLVVVAEKQTAGVGRLGRHWISEPEVGIYCSLLLRLPISPAKLPIVSLLLGLAACGAIQASTDLVCDLRWPNDVLINDRKVAGVLNHLVNNCVVAGIGINVNNTSFDPDLRTPATSLFLASGRTVSREKVFVALLESIDALCETLLKEGPEPILRSFTNASSYVVNRRVSIEENAAEGITAGLDENGFLLVQSDGGTIHRVASGGIRPA